MNIEIKNSNTYITGRNGVEWITIELDNGNKVQICEIESGVLSLKNITELGFPNEEYGLMVTPQSYTIVHIIPEG